MPHVTVGPLVDERSCREFAKRYIKRRLKEGPQHDVIEELSAYIGVWMWERERARVFLEDLEEKELRRRVEKGE